MNDERVFSGDRLIRHLETENEEISADMDTVEKMVYHTPCGSGDQHFVDVFYRDGEVQRNFNLKRVIWTEKEGAES